LNYVTFDVWHDPL
jgi:arsenite-transporting ATPase